MLRNVRPHINIQLNISKMKRVLFIDRDGTLIVEPPDTYQIDSLERLEFLPGVFRNLQLIRQQFDYEMVIVTNQDGLGSAGYPEESFRLIQEKMLTAFRNEGTEFDEIFIDTSLPGDNHPGRKPGTAMLTRYFEEDYDLAGSFVIGDRITDLELAQNLGAKGILIGDEKQYGKLKQELRDTAVLIASGWDEIYEYLRRENRKALSMRKTSETEISVELSLEGRGEYSVSTGLGFFDHMLEQLSRHSGCDLAIKATGDLQVDEHHTIEDVGISLGEAFDRALGSRKGIERYGFVLPMDESLASVSIDLGGRSWLEWEVSFSREKIGDMPAEMFEHFFRSFAGAARCSLHISAKGKNEHHLAEAIFKSFGRALKAAVRQDANNMNLPSTKGNI